MTSVVPQNQNRCVFVGNIPYDATEEQLVQICEEVGPVVSFRLVLDKETGKPKGYGFCEYKDEETALSARRNLQGYEINGRQLRVDFAENGKNADRSQAQGRGGPGAVPNIDGQKQAVASSSALNDPTGHQPLGIPSALSASSVMIGAIGGLQSGLANQPGPDLLTNYLARMSRHQLLELLSEIKLLATQNMPVATQLLQGNPQLLKALFQAEIMLGLAPPQAIQQMTSSLRPASHLGQSQLPPKLVEPVPAVPSIRPLAPQNPNLAATLQNPNLIVPQQNPNLVVRPQNPNLVVRPQNPNLVAPPKNPNVQPPIMQQNPRPQYGVGVVANQRPPPAPVASSSMQQSFYPHPPPQVAPNEVKPWSEPTRPPKLRRVEDLKYNPNLTVHNETPVNPSLAQTAVPSVGPATQHVASSAEQPHKLTSQISPEVVQQLLNLTPEQLTSLPIEQQQQVLQLQKMLSSSR